MHSPIEPKVSGARLNAEVHGRFAFRSEGLRSERVGDGLVPSQSMSTTEITEPADAAGLRAKYRAERDKRVRPDGNDQYLQPTGRFAHLLDDPYVPRIEREPLFDEVTVAFIGGGFSGLTTGARLQQAGIDDVRIIEGGGDFGGAWYWNRYPGAMCDTAAMVYLPLLEETGHRPTKKYVHAPEIQYDAIPACTYCHPEIASVGLTEDKAKAQGIPIKVGKMPFRALAKAARVLLVMV